MFNGSRQSEILSTFSEAIQKRLAGNAFHIGTVSHLFAYLLATALLPCLFCE